MIVILIILFPLIGLIVSSKKELKVNPPTFKQLSIEQAPDKVQRGILKFIEKSTRFFPIREGSEFLYRTAYNSKQYIFITRVVKDENSRINIMDTKVKFFGTTIYYSLTKDRGEVLQQSSRLYVYSIIEGDTSYINSRNLEVKEVK
jgi:hypothetical protein